MADTFHFLALLKASDPCHDRALKLHRVRWRRMITTDFVLLQVGDACSQWENHGDFLALLEASSRDERVEIVRLSPELFDRGVGLYRRRPDKDWPLTDCISFVVMQEEGPMSSRRTITSSRPGSRRCWRDCLVDQRSGSPVVSGGFRPRRRCSFRGCWLGWCLFGSQCRFPIAPALLCGHKLARAPAWPSYWPSSDGLRESM